MFKNVDVGVNGITGETVKYRCGWLTKRLCYLVVKKASEAADLKNTIVVTLYKGECSKNECRNSRGVDLLNALDRSLRNG